jgi:cyclohexanone monooxygenase
MIQAYKDITVKLEANATAAEFVREKIREVVQDPSVADKLSPRTYPLGTKRICIDSGYFETYNRDNVTLVDINEAPIEGLTAKGVKAGGEEYEVDAIVFATGFDAMTGALLAIDIRGTGGASLRTKWEAGPRTYLGVSVASFPNLFMITGPGSPSVLSNMIMAIEQHVDWITGCMEYLREHDSAAIEARVPDEDAWVEHVNVLAGKTLYPQANSWYLGANVPGKPRVFMPYVGGLNTYRAKCDEVAENGYAGFVISQDVEKVTP